MESRQLNQFITLKDSGEVKVKVDSNFLTVGYSVLDL